MTWEAILQRKTLMELEELCRKIFIKPLEYKIMSGHNSENLENMTKTGWLICGGGFIFTDPIDMAKLGSLVYNGAMEWVNKINLKENGLKKSTFSNN